MIDLREKIDEAVKDIRRLCELRPAVGITLGSGLGGVIDLIEDPVKIDFSQVANFPTSTIEGHEGVLVLGMIEGIPVVAMQGRAHYYEGYLMQTITLPIRVFKELGVGVYIVTNAAGALDRRFREGDIMLIEDHINMMGVNPLIGKNDESLGTRFPDMSEAYSERLGEIAKKSAKSLGLDLKSGVYAGVTGPNYETPAELKFLRTIGADAVGMSTVPEVIVARHAGLEVVGLSVITDLAHPEKRRALSHADVLNKAREAGPKLAGLIIEIVKGSLR